MSTDEIKKELKEMKELMEISIQQKSSHQSDLLKKIDGIEKWQTHHEQLDITRFDALPTKDEITKIFEELLNGKGRNIYKFIIGFGAVMIATVAIFGGFKTLLAWFGINISR